MAIVKDDPAHIAQREYMRKWRAANRDKVKASRERFWLKVHAEMRNQEQAVSSERSQHTGRD